MNEPDESKATAPPIVRDPTPASAPGCASRFTGLEQFLRELHLPDHPLAVGTLMLALNAALLVAYRIVERIGIGGRPDDGSGYGVNEFTWLVVLPAALTLANFFPYARENGSLLPQRRRRLAGWSAPGRDSERSARLREHDLMASRGWAAFWAQLFWGPMGSPDFSGAGGTRSYCQSLPHWSCSPAPIVISAALSARSRPARWR